MREHPLDSLALEDEDDRVAVCIDRVPCEPGAAGIERRTGGEQLSRAVLGPRPQLDRYGNAVHATSIDRVARRAIGTGADPVGG